MKNYKIEVAYIIILVLVILFSHNVFASTDAPIETSEDVEIEDNEIVEDVEIEDNEIVENEKIVEKSDKDTSNLVVSNNGEDTVDDSQSYDTAELLEVLQVTNTLLLIVVFGTGGIIGVMFSGKIFRWLIC